MHNYLIAALHLLATITNNNLMSTNRGIFQYNIVCHTTNINIITICGKSICTYIEVSKIYFKSRSKTEY
jgi:hypothetical protein